MRSLSFKSTALAASKAFFYGSLSFIAIFLYDRNLFITYNSSLPIISSPTPFFVSSVFLSLPTDLLTLNVTLLFSVK